MLGFFTVGSPAGCDNEASTPTAIVVPPKPAETPKWLDDAAARCALIASCAHEHDAARFADPGACVAAFGSRLARGEKDAVYNCLAPAMKGASSAKTCDAVSACTHDGEDPRAVRYCTAHAGALSACDGDVLVSCGGDDTGESTSVSCAEMGAKCNESQLAGGLIVRACFSEKQCPRGATGARCEGDSLVSCHDGAIERVKCDPGTRCAAHADAPGDDAAMCEPVTGGHCTEIEGKRCDGDKLVECVARGHGGNVRVTDCASAGLRCAGRGQRANCYVPTGVSCEPGPATCDGDALVFCAAGQPMRVSCTQLGLGGCGPAANGPNAACVVPKGR